MTTKSDNLLSLISEFNLTKKPAPFVGVTPKIIRETSFKVGQVNASYEELVKLFGKPIHEEGDFSKISTWWTLESTEDPTAMFSIYDWKQTSLYDDSLMSPQELRKLPEVEWTIGAGEYSKGKVKELIKYIERRRSL